MYHVWLQVWYDKNGWVDYDPTVVDRDPLRLIGLSAESAWNTITGNIDRADKQVTTMALENNRVKITFIFTIFPEEPEE